METIRISNHNAYFVVINKKYYSIKLVSLKEKISKYAIKHLDSIFINAGLFKIISKKAKGQFIINHQDYSIENYIEKDKYKKVGDKECYPLIINNNELFTLSHDRKDQLNNSKNLTNYDYAVCGWGTLIENNHTIDIESNEIIHGKKCKARQIIGILRNGNYFILTCEKAYYKDIITYLITKKVKFAYSLDGGHSTKLIIDGKQINYFKFNRKGRKYIPSVIEFKLQN